jgi:hypothetical protein
MLLERPSNDALTATHRTSDSNSRAESTANQTIGYRRAQTPTFQANHDQTTISAQHFRGSYSKRKSQNENESGRYEVAGNTEVSADTDSEDESSDEFAFCRSPKSDLSENYYENSHTGSDIESIPSPSKTTQIYLSRVHVIDFSLPGPDVEKSYTWGY